MTACGGGEGNPAHGMKSAALGPRTMVVPASPDGGPDMAEILVGKAGQGLAARMPSAGALSAALMPPTSVTAISPSAVPAVASMEPRARAMSVTASTQGTAADLVWYNPSSGETVLWAMKASSVASSTTLLQSADWKLTRSLDLNGDGQQDFIWENARTGQFVAWIMDGTQVSESKILLQSSAWKLTHVADFNGDGKCDLLFYNPQTGQTVVWLMDGTSVAASQVVFAHPDWKVAQVADLNGDGKADLIWRNDLTNQTVGWLMSGTSILDSAVLLALPDWQVSQIGDFNGDGKDDLVWVNARSGQTVLWLMNGLTASTSATLLTHATWRVSAVADLNGDGKADLLWANPATGEVAGWVMNGAAPRESSVLLGLADWHVVSQIDLDGDGKADLVWQNAKTHQTVAWIMNGLSVKSQTTLLALDGWEVWAQRETRSAVVTAIAGVGGVVAPARVTVQKGRIVQLQLRPLPDYAVDGVSGCPGSRNSNVFTTAPLQSDCQLQVSFAPWPGTTPVQPARAVAYVYTDTALQEAVQAFTTAVQADTNAAPTMILVSASADAAEIQRQLSAVPNLWGVFLIGDLPPSRRSSDGSQPADWAYLNPACSRPDDFFRRDCRTERWIARIPGQRIEVQAYLKRNVATRNGDRWRPAAEFIHGAWFGGLPPANAPSIYKDVPLWSDGAVSLINRGDAAQRRADFVACLGKAIELCVVNVHGAPTLMMFEGPGDVGSFYSQDTQLWTSADAASTPVRAKWIIIDSCSTGDFTDTNFLAGRMLHAGDALLVEANTVVTAISDQATDMRAHSEHAALARGANLAQVAQRWQSPTHFFGDPTVIMRPKPGDQRARLFADDQRLVGGRRRMDMAFPASPQGAPVQKDLIISNRGNAEMQIELPSFGNASSVDGQLLIGVAQPLMLTWTADRQLAPPPMNGRFHATLAPGEQMRLTFTFTPNHKADGSTWPGTHQVDFVVYSDDPDLPALQIEATAVVGG